MFSHITFMVNPAHWTCTAIFCYQWWTYGNMGVYELHDGSHGLSEVFLPPSLPLSTLWRQLVKLTCALVSHPFRPRINLPAKMLSFAALFPKMIHHKLGFQMLSTPLLHPDTIYFLSCTRTLNTSRARRLLGYHPIVSLEVCFITLLYCHHICSLGSFVWYSPCLDMFLVEAHEALQGLPFSWNADAEN